MPRANLSGWAGKLNLHDITCAAYLLAGADDDITTPEQVLDAAKYLGTPKDRIVQKTVPGGHIGLFMGARTLQRALADDCPVDRCPIDARIVAQIKAKVTGDFDWCTQGDGSHQISNLRVRNQSFAARKWMLHNCNIRA